MRKLFTGAAIAAAVLAPGIASADTGSVGVHYGNLDAGAFDIDHYGLDLGYNHEFANGWTLQGDAVSERLDTGGNLGLGYVDVAVGMRNDNHALYGFVGHNNIVFSDSLNIGVGGQIYLPQATLNGSVGYADFDSGGATNIHADGTYFFNDNFGVGADLGYIDFDGGPSANIYGVSGVYRFANSPFSVDVGYEVSDFDGSSEVDAIRLGFSMNFGTDSAREQSQAGSSFNGGARLYRDILSGL